MALPLPRRQSDITPGWLGEVLELPVSAISVRTIAEGAGFMGRLAVVDVEYAPDCDGPASVVVKLPTDEPGGVALGQMLRLWEREARFYMDLARHLPVRTPRCYWAGGEPESGIFGLVLEDLSALVNPDQLVGADDSQARAAVGWMGRLHAAESGGGHGAGMDWLPASATDPMYQGLQPMLEAVWPVFLANLGDQVPPGTAAVIEASIPSLTVNFTAQLLPPTLVHSDFRVDNLFFDGDDVVTLDWQAVAHGQGLYDLAYFLGGSLAVGTRRRLEDELVARYREALAGGGVPVPAEDDFFVLYRRTMLYTTGIAAMLLGQLDFTVNERAAELAREMARRFFTAAADLDVREFCRPR
jgi:hypothetical protein